MDSAEQIISTELLHYDALVYIHLDMEKPNMVKGNHFLLENLWTAKAIMESLNKPIFLFPWEETNQRYLPNGLIKPEFIIPSSHYKFSQVSPSELQGHVDYIAAKLGKLPEEVNIAAGGMALGVCVTNFMNSWCKKIDGPYSPFFAQPPLERMIGFGKIFPDLTDVSSYLLDSFYLNTHRII